MDEPRVLFVSHTGTISGAERVLLDVVACVARPAAFVFEDGALAQQLQGAGVAVRVARHGGSLAAVRRGNSLASAVPMLGRIGALVRELAQVQRDYDVVYANSQKAFTLSALAQGLVRRPLIWHLHDILSPQHFGARQRRMQSFLANRFAARVIVPSQVAADGFVQAGGREDLVHVVPNGVRMGDDPRPIRGLRAALGLPDQPMIGVFSRLAPWKGQDWLLRALALCPDVSLIVAGAPLFGEEAFEAQLRALCASLGLEQRVRFLGQRDDVPALMASVDAVVHPSLEAEPFGLTLVEAMLANVPLIASDSGAAADILDQGRFGTLVRPQDEAGLAGAIRAALLRRDGAQLEAARERARAVYGAPAMQKAVRAQIDAVVARRRA